MLVKSYANGNNSNSRPEDNNQYHNQYNIYTPGIGFPSLRDIDDDEKVEFVGDQSDHYYSPNKLDIRSMVGGQKIEFAQADNSPI